mgnify:CR=1 FL=1|jgi:hypothetical protein|tara:strand:- start:585 stop:1178 length:594 start_codon:yes stop_codon:yes gene_type:complete
MAIDKGIAISCGDLQQIGGIKHILLRSWTSGDIIAYDSSDNHTITSIKKAGPANADWFLYEFKAQEANMTVNATKENGSTAFECGLSFMLPKMGDAKFTELQNMLTDCMMGIAVDNNDTAFVLGVSEKYANTSASNRSQTFLNVASMEGGSGSAYTDQNGITVNLMCKQFELPREYTGTIAYYTDATPSTTFAATTT